MSLLAWKQGWQLKKIALFMYLISLFWGTFVAAQFFKIFKSARAGEWQFLGWDGRWDHMLIQDFLAANSDAIEVFRFEVILLMPIFIAINIFLSGGILHCGKTRADSWSQLWKGGSYHFVNVATNFVVFLILMGLWTALVIGGGVSWSFHHLSEVGSEIGSFYIVLSASILYFIGMIYFINASSVSKSYIVMEQPPFRAIKSGLLEGITRFIPLTGIFFVFLLVAFLILVLVQLAVDRIGYQYWLTLVLIVALQQVFLYARSLLRMMYLLSVQKLVDHSL